MDVQQQVNVVNALIWQQLWCPLIAMLVPVVFYAVVLWVVYRLAVLPMLRDVAKAVQMVRFFARQCFGPVRLSEETLRRVRADLRR